MDAFASSFTAFTATNGAFLSWILRARNKEQNDPLPTRCLISHVSLSIVLGLIMMMENLLCKYILAQVVSYVSQISKGINCKTVNKSFYNFFVVLVNVSLWK